MHFASAFASVARYNVYNSQKEIALSDIAMENVEALAVGESNRGWTLDRNAICETSHNDYPDYRNN
ncbi:NVEALA domain-containing protein [uncultured Bacteroides sp.]|uniref:NVEALA domain-containing protein n=1 Tax=uncultured Bacteroides sp. TaxID=162156 RepID=UPI00280B9903|nr:NVEALA domain-containing protein [uncultured Bacteroides sp.]